MPELYQLARPMVGRRARLHPDEARRELSEERDHLLTAKLPDENDLTLMIYRVNLEEVLGQINADGANLHVDDPLM